MKYSVIFDGGSIGNGQPNARAYGSFRVSVQAGRELFSGEPIRFEFPDLRTNNEAEFQIASEALGYICKNTSLPLSEIQVELIGDSMLAVQCLSKRWKLKKPHLKTIASQFWALAAKLSEVKLVWHGRANSVAVLGH